MSASSETSFLQFAEVQESEYSAGRRQEPAIFEQVGADLIERGTGKTFSIIAVAAELGAAVREGENLGADLWLYRCGFGNAELNVRIAWSRP